VGSGVGSPDADVVEPAVVSEGDHAGGVDPVAADPVVGVGVPASCGGRPEPLRMPGHFNPHGVGSAVLCLSGGAGRSSCALIALGVVEDEFAEEFSGEGVDDADVAAGSTSGTSRRWPCPGSC
jgi:hypothetical protein